ncbi:Hypothetical protein CINCED_3A015275 [Cinara cedri]|uniref:ABC transporter domain-containing protein n=1 Tax=Cinara cedri TaxID=506608 RepID=A0A5E4N905_9HEMI|nr:Hypothetical protein CINCED_3A015275 [Cinara cedri]
MSFFGVSSPKMLDLRYNEMSNDWDGTGEVRSVRPRDVGKWHAHHGQLVLSWKRLNVSVKTVTQKFFSPSKIAYKQILYNVSGNVQCGSLLGIMGPSGSGKTTLMSTISHRTNGNFDGELLLNGQPVSEEVMIKISGFVPQHDISFDQLTALEHLSLMAKLKMDQNTTETALNEQVDRIVTSLAMGQYANTRISFLSGGERKKVALAVQLLNDPPILFCDEITTGLDSYSAAHIVNTLKSVSRTGKIVVCTIHQPASGVFDKFDDVILLTEGRLAYQGPVSMVNQLTWIKCASCLRSTVKQIATSISLIIKYNISIDSKYATHNYVIFRRNPPWTTHFTLIFGRSTKCFLRSFQSRLLELGTLLLFSVFLSFPYANLQFDTKAVQNWEGHWLVFIINFVFHFSFSGIAFYQQKLSTVHREIHNKLYPLSVHFISELLIMIVWIVIKMLFCCIPAFYIVGVKWNLTELLVFFILALTAFSSGSLLSSHFNRVENIVIMSTAIDTLSLTLSGAYVSLKSLPKTMRFLRRFSIFFLGSETVSVLFWEEIESIPCADPDNCLDSGTAVLNKYGYNAGEFNTDMATMVTFIVIANVASYFGVLKKTKTPPAY